MEAAQTQILLADLFFDAAASGSEQFTAELGIEALLEARSLANSACTDLTAIADSMSSARMLLQCLQLRITIEVGL